METCEIRIKPPDIITRPITTEELARSKLWWQGPEFLRKDKSEWPKAFTPSEIPPEVKSEMKKEVILAINQPKPTQPIWIKTSVGEHINGLFVSLRIVKKAAKIAVNWMIKALSKSTKISPERKLQLAQIKLDQIDYRQRAVTFLIKESQKCFQ